MYVCNVCMYGMLHVMVCAWREGGREGGRSGSGGACKCLTRAPIIGYWMYVWFLVVVVVVFVANGMGWDGANDRWGISVRVSG